MVWSRHQGERTPVSPADFRDWKRQATAFEDLNAWNGVEVNLATDDRPDLVLAGFATPGCRAVDRAEPVAGAPSPR